MILFNVLEPMLSQFQFLGHTLMAFYIITSLTAMALFIHLVGHLI